MRHCRYTARFHYILSRHVFLDLRNESGKRVLNEYGSQTSPLRRACFEWGLVRLVTCGFFRG